jgi:large subunit ribosomal protein L18
LIDDESGVTLTAASSLDGEVKTAIAGQNKVTVSRSVGELVAKRAADKGIKVAVFDRGGNKYHGRVKALAEAAREGGLVI